MQPAQRRSTEPENRLDAWIEAHAEQIQAIAAIACRKYPHTGGFDPEDLAASVVADLYKKKDSLEIPSNNQFLAYVRLIIRGKARAYFRKKSNRLARLSNPAGAFARSTGNPAKQAQAEDDAAALSAAKAALSSEQLDVIELMSQGQTLSETARLLNRPVSTVNDQYVSALSRLRRSLERNAK